MPPSRDEFKRRFRFPLVGMAAWGCWIEDGGTPTQRAEARVEMPGHVETMLDRIYDYLCEQEKKGTK